MTSEAKAQKSERNAGLLLIAAAALAIGLANSGGADLYHHLLDTKLGPPLPRMGVLTVHEWIADGLMAIFFLLVGLELKREWFDGRLSTPAKRRLPILAAVAGIITPALIFLAIAGGDPALRSGWAIPAATDIAFAIGVLALAGPRVSPSIRVLLVTIAVVDDVGAVLIIALVYSHGLSLLALGAAALILAALFAVNRAGVRTLWPYLIGFVAMWIAVLSSGIHPTIAGVLTALAVPHSATASPLRRLEHAIHPYVMFGIMPLFALASSGVAISGGLSAIREALPLAVMLGLFIGKQLGVFAAVWLALRLRIAERPVGASDIELYGAALLCGVGFTMSLFIGPLAYTDQALIDAAKVGTLSGSLLSAVCGWAVLRFGSARDPGEEDDDDLFARGTTDTPDDQERRSGTA